MKDYSILLVGVLMTSIISCNSNNVEIAGELKQWHTITLTFSGPDTDESAASNPFLNYRLTVTFINGNTQFDVPGFYASDGNAAETSATSGNKWKVRFVPNKAGEWHYKTSFVTGKNIAVSEEAGIPISFDGAGESFTILESDKKGNDFRSKGRLIHKNSRYLVHEGNGEIFLKGGVDSPENMLGYVDFDGTYFGETSDEQREGESMTNGNLHRFAPHISDWKEGNPTWQNGKGKGLIGGLNYLASQGVNSAYMITNNVEGDGKDVFPWTTYNQDFTRFDVSKLEQWEIVFAHMEALGLMCHFVTQETENELLLNEGDLGLERKLYYRELIARFGHHLAITWNLGEENGPAPWMDNIGQNDQQRKDMASYIRNTDPYNNLIVLHTLPIPEIRDEMLTALLNHEPMGGPSLQTQPDEVHAETLKWRRKSDENGKPWIVCSDEIGPHTLGALPDAIDPEHDTLRQQVLWGNLMAGGAGVEWYFGYLYPNTDLTCEDWRSRESLYQQTKIALDFFRKYIPMDKMEPDDEMILNGSGYALSNNDAVVVVYIPMGERIVLNLSPNSIHHLDWFDPRNGGELTKGDDVEIHEKGTIQLPSPPSEVDKDWVVVLRKK